MVLKHQQETSECFILNQGINAQLTHQGLLDKNNVFCVVDWKTNSKLVSLSVSLSVHHFSHFKIAS